MPHLSHQHLAAVSTAISDSSYPTNAMPQWPTLSPGLLHTTQVQPFAPPNPATAAQIEEAKDVWRKHKLTFELCQATEKALIAQIVDSIDSIYLRALLNRVTGQYSNSIRAVLAHLFTTHGKITPQQVKATEMAVYYSMNYSIILPVDTVFNSIDDLADLAGHANSPLTPQQMIDLAFVILAKEPILQQDLRLWNRRPIPERTWANMRRLITSVKHRPISAPFPLQEVSIISNRHTMPIQLSPLPILSPSVSLMLTHQLPRKTLLLHLPTRLPMPTTLLMLLCYNAKHPSHLAKRRSSLRCKR
jgi:hypothetical protein